MGPKISEYFSWELKQKQFLISLGAIHFFTKPGYHNALFKYKNKFDQVVPQIYAESLFPDDYE